MTYRSVSVTRRGGPEALEVVTNDLRAPATGEARIRVLASTVTQDDVGHRRGNRPFLPKIPFVPGYAIVGTVDAVGDGVSDVRVGDRVAALTVTGGYTEVLYWQSDRLVQVPEALDPAEAVTLILNYLVAYQVLHRIVHVKSGNRVLIIGASGGVGTAFLQLGKLAGLKMYGLASKRKHHILTDAGAIPIDYHTEDFVEVLRAAEPGGIDYVFNGMAEDTFDRGFEVLRRGGTFVHYGAPQSFSRFVVLLVKLLKQTIRPRGKSLKAYGTHRVGIDQMKEDWTTLFGLLAKEKIRPVIAARFPILEAAQANRLLESGSIIGNIVLLAPELL